jgi:hypothetical protein
MRLKIKVSISAFYAKLFYTNFIAAGSRSHIGRSHIGRSHQKNGQVGAASSREFKLNDIEQQLSLSICKISNQIGEKNEELP